MGNFKKESAKFALALHVEHQAVRELLAQHDTCSMSAMEIHELWEQLRSAHQEVDRQVEVTRASKAKVRGVACS